MTHHFHRSLQVVDQMNCTITNVLKMQNQKTEDTLTLEMKMKENYVDY